MARKAKTKTKARAKQGPKKINGKPRRARKGDPRQQMLATDNPDLVSMVRADDETIRKFMKRIVNKEKAADDARQTANEIKGEFRELKKQAVEAGIPLCAINDYLENRDADPEDLIRNNEAVARVWLAMEKPRPGVQLGFLPDAKSQMAEEEDRKIGHNAKNGDPITQAEEAGYVAGKKGTSLTKVLGTFGTEETRVAAQKGWERGQAENQKALEKHVADGEQPTVQ